MQRRWLRGFHLRLLQELRRQQQHASLFCDTVLQADGVSIPVHSCVLAAFSPQLARALSAARFLTSGQGRLLQLQSVRAQTLLKLVGLLYSGELQCEGELEQEEVLAVASWLGIESLVEANGTGKEGVEVGEDGWAQHMKKMCREEDGEPVSRTEGEVVTVKEKGWGRGSGDASRMGGTASLCRSVQGTGRRREVEGRLSESMLEDITSPEASAMTLSEDVSAAPSTIFQAEASVTRNDTCSRKRDGEVDRMEARDIAELETIEQREGKAIVGRKGRGGHLLGTGSNVRVRERQISKIRLRRQSRAALWEIVSTRDQDVTMKARARCPMTRAGHCRWQSDLQESQAVVNSCVLNMARRPCSTQSPSRLHASALCVPEDVIMGLDVLPSLPEKPNSAHACWCQPHQPQNRNPPSAGLPPHWMPEVSMGISSAGGSISGVVTAPKCQQSMGTADTLHTPPHYHSPHNLPFAFCMENTDKTTGSQTCSSLAWTSEPHLALSLACSQIAVDRGQDGNLQSMPAPVPAIGLCCSSLRGQSSKISNCTGPVKETNKVLHNMVACAPRVLKQTHTMQIPALSLSLRAISGDKTVPEEPAVPVVSPLDSTLNFNVFIAKDDKTLQDPNSPPCSHQTPEQGDSEVSELRDATLLNWCRSNVNFSHGFWNNILLDKPFKRTSCCGWQSADANISRARNSPLMVNDDFRSPKRQQGLTAFASRQANVLPEILSSLHQTDDFKPSAPDGTPNWKEMCVRKCRSPLQIKQVNKKPPKLQEPINVADKVPVSKALLQFLPSAAGRFSSQKRPQWLSPFPEGPLSSVTNAKHSKVPKSIAKHSKLQDVSCMSPWKSFAVSPSSDQEGSYREKRNMWHGEMKYRRRREEYEINTETRRDSCVKRKFEKQKQCEVLGHKKRKVDDYIFSPMSITEKILITEIKMPVESSGDVSGLSAVRRISRKFPRRLLTYVSKISRDGKSREGCDALGKKEGLGKSHMEAGEELEDERSGNDTVRVGHESKVLVEGERQTELKNTNEIQPRRVLQKAGMCLTKTEELKTGERECLDKNDVKLLETHPDHVLRSVATGNRHETKDVAGVADAMDAGMTSNKPTSVSGMEKTTERREGINNQTAKIKEKEVRCEETDITEEAEAEGQVREEERVEYRLETTEQGGEKTFRIYQKFCVEVIESTSEKSSVKGMETRKQREDGPEEVDVEVIEMGDGENGCGSGGVDEHPREDQTVCTFTEPITVLEDEEIDIMDFSSPPATLLFQLPEAVQVDLSPGEASEEDQEIDVIT